MKVGDLVRVKDTLLFAGQMGIVESIWDRGNMVLLKLITSGKIHWFMFDEVETPDDLT